MGKGRKKGKRLKTKKVQKSSSKTSDTHLKSYTETVPSEAVDNKQNNNNTNQNTHTHSTHSSRRSGNTRGAQRHDRRAWVFDCK